MKLASVSCRVRVNRPPTRSGVVEDVLRRARRLAIGSGWDGGHEHLHARKRRPPGRTTTQAAAASGGAETLTNPRRGDPPRPKTDPTLCERGDSLIGGPGAAKPTRLGSRCVAEPPLVIDGPGGAGSRPIVVRPRACGQAASPSERRRAVSPGQRARTATLWPYPAGRTGRSWHANDSARTSSPTGRFAAPARLLQLAIAAPSPPAGPRRGCVVCREILTGVGARRPAAPVDIAIANRCPFVGVGASDRAIPSGASGCGTSHRCTSSSRPATHSNAQPAQVGMCCPWGAAFGLAGTLCGRPSASDGRPGDSVTSWRVAWPGETPRRA